ncbi:hypothetical protein AYL99_11452 [Fonsecaea erecta]|uniref:Guanine nucleotide-binding protein subunit alpha n=1 Tax=Fonsecaea erecta TaxID=1367422 RepID=A0A178Z476_9EURO|nr:hypothetical protein AYL99_11452 [Fonsecaea erecta]OAP54351.1 hypothetical protein AYL99_11452 [Fonsecaea erecta]
MGSALGKEDRTRRTVHMKVDKRPRYIPRSRKKEVKILMLGAGDSGKSTLLKQLKLINGGGYSTDERCSFKGVIFANVVQSMQAILEAMGVFGIRLANPAAEQHVSTISSQRPSATTAELSPEVYNAIRVLWADMDVKTCFSRCSKFQVCDSAQYYFESIDRIAAPSFVPNDQDILRSRHKTTGVAEFVFTANRDTVYRVIDVGGQRSERKKWMHYFEGVDLVLFLVALSEYDQALYEDGSVNRLQETIDLFRNVCEARWFTHATVQLVFNKTDLLREKLLRSPLEAYFGDYQGGSDYTAACKYISDKFTSPGQMRGPESFICATDTAQVEKLIGSIVGTLIFEQEAKYLTTKASQFSADNVGYLKITSGHPSTA